MFWPYKYLGSSQVKPFKFYLNVDEWQRDDSISLPYSLLHSGILTSSLDTLLGLRLLALGAFSQNLKGSLVKHLIGAFG